MTANNYAPDGLEYGIRPAGYRLPDSTRVGKVVLQVSDLARSMDFYTRILGLRVLDRSAGGGTLGPHGEDLVLVELREHAGVRPVPRGGRLGLYHFAVLLPDRASLGRFVTHLASVGERAGASDHLVSEALYLTDPDGLGIEVYADRPRGSWRTVDGQLVMATEPLNLGELSRAAGNESWGGMPVGTRMGHVHLHVEDIGGAEAFYHEGLGLDKMVWGYPGALFLSAGGYHHHLGVNTWAMGAPAAGDEDARLLEWELLLPSDRDAREAMANLAHHGHQAEPDDPDLIRDPWGTAIRIIS